MCEGLIGARCAADTAAQVAITVREYAERFPDGPSLDPLTANGAEPDLCRSQDVELFSPDAPDRVIFEGSALTASRCLRPGEYSGRTRHGEPVRVVVRPTRTVGQLRGGERVTLADGSRVEVVGVRPAVAGFATLVTRADGVEREQLVRTSLLVSLDDRELAAV